ncbi:hypothetical protein KKH43_05335 [Patescibacteria group bacterium]|nr:hypothetical protein [Patescibacteria group bacterium]
MEKRILRYILVAGSMLMVPTQAQAALKSGEAVFAVHGKHTVVKTRFFSLALRGSGATFYNPNEKKHFIFGYLGLAGTFLFERDSSLTLHVLGGPVEGHGSPGHLFSVWAHLSLFKRVSIFSEIDLYFTGQAPIVYSVHDVDVVVWKCLTLGAELETFGSAVSLGPLVQINFGPLVVGYAHLFSVQQNPVTHRSRFYVKVFFGK